MVFHGHGSKKAVEMELSESVLDKQCCQLAPKAFPLVCLIADKKEQLATLIIKIDVVNTTMANYCFFSSLILDTSHEESFVLGIDTLDIAGDRLWRMVIAAIDSAHVAVDGWVIEPR